MNVLLSDSVLFPVLMAGPPIAACCWLLWRAVRAPICTGPESTTQGPADKRWRWAVAFCAAAMYTASLLLPTAAASITKFGGSTIAGWEAFRAWTILVAWEPWDLHWWLLSLAWLANPAIWAAVGLTAAGRWRAARLAAGCGLVLGLVPLPWYFGMVAGLPGYWAWVGSAGLVLAAGLGPWHRIGSESAVAGGLAADYADAVSPPNHARAPDRGGRERLNRQCN